MPESEAGNQPELDTHAVPNGHFRLLLVATEALVGSELSAEIERRFEGRRGSVLVVAPAVTDSAVKHALGDVDAAIETAQERLAMSVDRLRGDGISVEGTVGDSDPVMAIDDALATFNADEIVIVTGTDEDAWVEGDLFERARERFRPPITRITLQREAPGEAEIKRQEHSGEGIDLAEPGRAGVSANFPKLSMRDLAGIVVAIVGTIVLVILAASCGGSSVGGDNTDTGCVVRYVVAGIVALVNVAHVVGLFLFESVGHRGLSQRLFARLSLFGTPAAIVVSLLAH